MGSPLLVRLTGGRLECLAWEALLKCAPEVQVSHDPPAVLPGALTLLIGTTLLSRVTDAAGERPRSPLVLITRGEAEELLLAVLHGVDVLVSPEDSLATLMEALRAAASGAAYCSPQLLPALLDAVRRRVPAASPVTLAEPTPLLSPREEEIAALVAAGLTNGQVAHRLHVEERTVKSHLTSVYGKLAVRGRNELRARWPELPKRYG